MYELSYLFIFFALPHPLCIKLKCSFAVLSIFSKKKDMPIYNKRFIFILTVLIVQKKKKKDIQLRNQSIVENNRMVLHDNITQMTIHAW